MRQYIRKATAADVLLPLPSDLPVASATAVLYGPDGAADWDPAHSVTHPAWALADEAPAGASSLAVSTWGAYRIPQPGEELTLSDATTPAGNPTETIIVDRVSGTTLHVRDPLRLTWAASSVLQPRVLRVPLSASDTATAGRAYRLEATVTLDASVPASERTHYLTELLDCVAHVPRCTLSLTNLRSLYPNLFGRLSGDLREESSGVEALRDRCFWLVVSDISAKVKPDHIYSDSDLEAPTVARMLLELARDGRLYPEDVDRTGVVEGAYGHYMRTMDATLSSIGWVDSDEDGVPDDGETQRSVLPPIVWSL